MFSERTLSRTAGRLRRSPSYRAKFWDDQNRLLNEPAISDHYTENFLNKMSVGEFNAKLKRTGTFRVTHYECPPPRGNPYLRPLLKIPFFREHGSSFVTYVLTKPA